MARRWARADGGQDQGEARYRIVDRPGQCRGERYQMNAQDVIMGQHALWGSWESNTQPSHSRAGGVAFDICRVTARYIVGFMRRRLAAILIAQAAAPNAPDRSLG
jgi:hypothetical protein